MNATVYTRRCGSPMLVTRALKTKAHLKCSSCGATEEVPVTWLKDGWTPNVTGRTCNAKVPCSQAEFFALQLAERDRAVERHMLEHHRTMAQLQESWDKSVAVLATEGPGRLEWMDSTFETGARLALRRHVNDCYESRVEGEDDIARIKRALKYFTDKVLGYHVPSSTSATDRVFHDYAHAATVRYVQETRNLVEEIESLSRGEVLV